jgi:RimJ/RimL family protein N-acetyltransferase
MKNITVKELEKYFLSMLKVKSDYHFMIILGKIVIGHISLMKRKKKWYETTIVIGEKKYWNKGYGTNAIKIIISKAKIMGIKKIYLEVRPDNKKAINVYKNCGFQSDGYMKYPQNKYLPLTLKMINFLN